jgi:hypothetical protein
MPVKIYGGKYPLYSSNTKYWRAKYNIDILAAGGQFASSITTRYYLKNGSQQWTANHGVAVFGSCFDGIDIWTCGSRFSNNTIRKYSISGTLLFSRDWGATTNRAMAYSIIDNSVIVAGGPLSSINLRKYNTSGTLLWSASPLGNTGEIYGLAINPNNGNILIAHDSVTNITARLTDAYGSVIRTLTNTVTGYGSAYSTDNTWILATQRVFYSVLKMSADLTTQIWSFDTGGIARKVAVDLDGNIYVVGNRASVLSRPTLVTLWKLSPAGAFIWSTDHGAQLNSVAIDNDGNIWVGGVRSSNITTRKYSPTGTLLLSLDHGTSIETITANILPTSIS